MARIPVEKKEGAGTPWWLWLLGLLLLIGLIWLLAEAFGGDEEELEPVTEMTTPEAVAEAPAVTIGDILGTPNDYIGDTFGDVYPRAEVTVESVPTDRGFWIEDESARMFVVIIDDPMEEPKDINPGQTLRIDEGVLRDRTYLPQIEGEPLDQDTQNIAQQQPLFLTVDEQYINILEQGSPQPGTDPAQSVQ